MDGVNPEGRHCSEHCAMASNNPSTVATSVCHRAERVTGSTAETQGELAGALVLLFNPNFLNASFFSDSLDLNQNWQ